MEPPSSTLDDYFSLGIILILILLFNALVKGSEKAFYSLSENNPEDFKSVLSKWQNRLLNSDYIDWTTRQILIFLQLAAVFVVAELFYLLFSPGNNILSALVILAISAVILKYSGEVFCSYISKEGNDKKFIGRISGFISVLLNITYPVNRLLSYFTQRLQKSRGERDAHSFEEFTEVENVNDLQEVEEKKLLKGIAGLSNTSVSQIMKPRVDIVSLNIEMNSKDVIKIATECGFSRLPVCGESLDNIKGFLYVKDLVRYLRYEERDFEWHKHIREAYFVPGSKKIDDLLEEFRQKKIHLALVVDEYGGTDGLVTLEDILEEIVGEISDETDKNE